MERKVEDGRRWRGRDYEELEREIEEKGTKRDEEQKEQSASQSSDDEEQRNGYVHRRTAT
jgi:hypothetical protein